MTNVWDALPKPKPKPKVAGAKPMPKPGPKPEPQKSITDEKYTNTVPVGIPASTDDAELDEVTVPEPDAPTFKLTGAKTPREQAEAKHVERIAAGGNGTKSAPVKGLGGLNPEFVQVVRGRPYVLYAGLLDLAHRMGMTSINTHIVQLPTKENGEYCVVEAQVTMADRGGKAQFYTGIGDASPQSVSMAGLKPHMLRLAETRAKARALRDAVNVGVAAIEELGGDMSEPKAGEE